MKNNQLQLVTFEQAKRLDKAGFDLPTYGHHYVVEKIIPPSLDMTDRALYNVPVGGLIGFGHGKNTVPAPTVALALKWMRDVKGIYGAITRDESGWYFTVHNRKGAVVKFFDNETWPTYEAVESALLDELIEMLKRKDNRTDQYLEENEHEMMDNQ